MTSLPSPLHFGSWQPLSGYLQHIYHEDGSLALEKGTLVTFDAPGWRFHAWVITSEPSVTATGAVRFYVRDAIADPLDVPQARLVEVPSTVTHLIALEEHFSACIDCLQLQPCEKFWSAEVVEQSLEIAQDFEDPNACPHCGAPIDEAPNVTYLYNLFGLSGAPVTFHTVGDCKFAAEHYETMLVANGKGQPQITCSGTLVLHATGEYTCSLLMECTGPHARHVTLVNCNGSAQEAFPCTPAHCVQAPRHAA